jgi:hypothetical protein
MSGIPLTIIMILVGLGVIFLSFYISMQMTRRAVTRVLEIFESKNAIGIQQAKTIDELGLRPPGFVERLVRFRDYRQNAMKLLAQAGIVFMTEEGKLFIPREKFEEISKQRKNFDPTKPR